MTPIIVRWLTRHKCILTQGAAMVNMWIIFFIGGVSIQTWCEKHLQWTPNICIPIIFSMLMAWIIGRIMLDYGMITAEQTFYAERNDVLDKIVKEKSIIKRD